MENNTPTFTDATAWISEWMAEKHPELTPKITEQYQSWNNDYSEYTLFEGDFGEPRFWLESIEMRRYVIFGFVIPETKEKLFQILEILDV